MLRTRDWYRTIQNITPPPRTWNQIARKKYKQFPSLPSAALQAWQGTINLILFGFRCHSNIDIEADRRYVAVSDTANRAIRWPENTSHSTMFSVLSLFDGVALYEQTASDYWVVRGLTLDSETINPYEGFWSFPSVHPGELWDVVLKHAPTASFRMLSCCSGDAVGLFSVRISTDLLKILVAVFGL